MILDNRKNEAAFLPPENSSLPAQGTGAE
jgi:hypothetical protein